MRDTVEVARELLGTRIVRVAGNTIRTVTITETEAYLGPEDTASHARFEKSKRSAVMFGPPGHWYVYLIYGQYAMLNVVTEKEGVAGAVLIRGAKEVSGPGRLSRFLDVDRSLNAMPAEPSSGLYLLPPETAINPEHISATPRIGIEYATEPWKSAPLRFVLKI